MKDIILIGTGKTAEDIFVFINDYKLFNVIGFAVDVKYKTTDSFCNLPVFDIEGIENLVDIQSTSFFICTQWNYLNKVRKDIYLRLKEKNFQFANVISPNAIIHTGSVLGTNCWVSDGVIIESNCNIGDNVFIKSNAVIGHFVSIENHCFIGISGIIGGSSVIGEQSFIGIRATVFDEVQIGKKCLIGACSVVKRSIPNYTIVKTSLNNIDIIQSNKFLIEEKLVARKSVR
jgi:sugar O-acyltransferase (sialic acid O-acetyltransferase NeuD family)